MNSIPSKMVLAATALAASLCAQGAQPQASQWPQFKIEAGFAGGRLEHRTEQSPLDGDAVAGFGRLSFEGIGDGAIGGGLRFEGFGSEDDLFTSAGFPAIEAGMASLFGHVSFRMERERFVMPIRVGLLFHGYAHEEVATGNTVQFSSFGPQFEVEPELALIHEDQVMWSLYAQFGFGIAATSVDVDTVGDDFETSSFNYGFELGTRLYLGHLVAGLGLVIRGQDIDESDVENGNFVFGIEQDFTGVLLSIGVVF